MTRAIRRHFGVLLCVLALTATVLGVAGFRACDPACTLATALYRSMQLFYWNYFPWNTAAEATLPWTLELARWLAPLATLGALSRVAVALFQRRWDTFRARHLRGHLVICGAGEKGATLAKDLAKSGRQVAVIIEKDDDRAEVLAMDGAIVIHGDGSDPEVLREAGVQRASRLVITTGDDHENLSIAMAAAHIASADGHLTIHAHSGNATLCDLYQRNRAMAVSLGGAVQMRAFNHSRNVARQTIQEHPPKPAEGEAHVVLPGLSSLGAALAVEYALNGHFTEDRRIQLHVVGARASAELAALRNLYPSIDRCAAIEALDLTNGEHFSTRVATLVNSCASNAHFTIFAGFAKDRDAFAHALELLELTRHRPALRVLIPDGPVRASAEANAALRPRIAFLPPLGSTCGYEAVVDEALDRTARRIHEQWLAETSRQIEAARASGDETRARRHEAKATFRPWDELSEEQKGASRSQADHIPFKIRAAGLDPNTVRQADWARLPADTIETLARMEHARWAAYYWMTGWTFAAQRDDERKEHPDLVAYDGLDEQTKEYDRAAVRNLAGYLRP